MAMVLLMRLNFDVRLKIFIFLSLKPIVFIADSESATLNYYKFCQNCIIHDKTRLECFCCKNETFASIRVQCRKS